MRRLPQSLCLIGLALTFTGVMFKLNHLAGAHTTTNTGAAILVAGLIPLGFPPAQGGVHVLIGLACFGATHLTGPMKNPIVYTLVGGLVLFVWQFLSYAAINLHGEAQAYTPKDQEILAFLETIELEHGMYALGAPSPEERNDPALQEAYSSARKAEAGGAELPAELDQQHGGQPRTQPVHEPADRFLLFWMMRNLSDGSLKKRLMLTVAAGWVGFMFFPYSHFIWYKNPDIWAYMIDATVPFAVLGLLGPKSA